MSTHTSTATPVAPPVHGSKKDTAPPDKRVECPNCHAVFQESALLTPAPPAEYPKMLYKVVPKPKVPAADDPPVEVETSIVNSEDEQKKAEGDGFQEDVPQPKAAEHKGSAHEEPKKK